VESDSGLYSTAPDSLYEMPATDDSSIDVYSSEYSATHPAPVN